MDLKLIDYSDKCIAVVGDTAAIKDQLKDIGGRFNPSLKIDGRRMAGDLVPVGDGRGRMRRGLQVTAAGGGRIRRAWPVIWCRSATAAQDAPGPTGDGGRRRRDPPGIAGDLVPVGDGRAGCAGADR